MRVALSVSTRLRENYAYDYLPQAYVPFVVSLGLAPVLIPNSHPDPAAYAETLDVEGLILTGGGDIDPAVYHAPNNGSLEIVAQRDNTEKRLLALALARDWPVLGICRGFQMVNVFFGGSLVQDIPSQIGDSVDHGAGMHAVALCDARFSAALGAESLVVNTHHHQGVQAAHRAPGLDVFAVSEPDSIIEGIAHRDHPILAVQWHPERRDYPAAAVDVPLFRGVFERAWWR